MRFIHRALALYSTDTGEGRSRSTQGAKVVTIVGIRPPSSFTATSGSSSGRSRQTPGEQRAYPDRLLFSPSCPGSRCHPALHDPHAADGREDHMRCVDKGRLLFYAVIVTFRSSSSTSSTGYTRARGDQDPLRDGDDKLFASLIIIRSAGMLVPLTLISLTKISGTLRAERGPAKMVYFIRVILIQSGSSRRGGT